MRRIILVLLICLLPLQSFASGVMSAKMASMDLAMSQMEIAGSVQAPCHMTSQVEQPASQDCCGSQAMCQALCNVVAALPSLANDPQLFSSTSPIAAFAVSFQSAETRTGFKPPIL
jgi:hypothetical protein